VKNGKCEICGSTNKVQRFKGEQALCGKHYLQMHRHGRIFNRTRKDKNEIVIKDDYAEIILYNMHGNETCRTLIDIEDIERVSKLKWYSHTERIYVVSVNSKDVKEITNGGKRLALHRYIMNPHDNMVIDHINHNVLDNRKINLRICTQKENCQNRIDKKEGN